MNAVNIMNFVRAIDEREEDSTRRMLELTEKELELVNGYGLDNTFLLQYDAYSNPDFVELFKTKATPKTELGLWYEIVEPLTSACGLPYRSENGWKWDWHIIPGFSMAYSPEHREALIDEAMRKFREVFGYYPKTVASWLIDTHTLNYLNENYDISAVAICRDQTNTDAYTLLGGYFSKAYYPSVNNIFTPAQSDEMQTNIPVFRLLGPCPIHNYDNHKFSSEEFKALGRKTACFTLEPCWYMGSTEKTAKWLFDCYYGNESLGFSHTQIGQENSFIAFKDQVLEGIRMQIELLLNRADVEFQKMSVTGETFKSLYSQTPATSLVALNNFDTADVQSVYYCCKNYAANLFRYEEKVFIRSLYLFDERKNDIYLENSCTTFDAIYENLPIIDTLNASEKRKKHCGLIIDTNGASFETEKLSDGVLNVSFGDDHVTFYEDRIEIGANKLLWCGDDSRALIGLTENGVLSFEYKGSSYAVVINGASSEEIDGSIAFCSEGDSITLIPKAEG